MLLAGPDKGAYYHPFFVKGRPCLSDHIPRMKIKGAGPRRPGRPELEPNFYEPQSSQRTTLTSSLGLASQLQRLMTSPVLGDQSILPIHTRPQDESERRRLVLAALPQQSLLLPTSSILRRTIIPDLEADAILGAMQARMTSRLLLRQAQQRRDDAIAIALLSKVQRPSSLSSAGSTRTLVEQLLMQSMQPAPKARAPGIDRLLADIRRV